MANPLCGNLERRIDCASYRLFDSCNYTMVVRNDHRRALRFRLRSRDLSRQGRTEIRRRALCDPERNYHRSIDRPFYRHVGHQNDLIHDLDNYPRFTGYVYLSDTKSPGIEALFPIHR